MTLQEGGTQVCFEGKAVVVLLQMHRAVKIFKKNMASNEAKSNQKSPGFACKLCANKKGVTNFRS
ncbi:MAG: hypothetical protein Q7U74_11725 [Saprospiraceae bacterium]|nr:hypothetical protein [Saprospiraceae bacterium]